MSTRYQIIDLARGLAILLMVIYHFCFDLTSYGYTDFDFYKDPFWLNFRTFILSSFLLLVGFSVWLVNGRGIDLKASLRRIGLILFNAVLISVATWYLYGDRYIYFGVLHFIALASGLILLFIRFYWLNLFFAVGFISLGFYQSTIFDQSNLNWIGMMTYKPYTEDYVPLIPWFGVVLIGLFIARFVEKNNIKIEILSPKTLSYFRYLILAGRHSLMLYMLHQPILVGILELAEIIE